MFINEDGNDEANNAVGMAMKQVAEKHSSEFSVDLQQVDGNRSEPKEFLKNCNLIQKIICTSAIATIIHSDSS